MHYTMVTKIYESHANDETEYMYEAMQGILNADCIAAAQCNMCHLL